MMLRGHSYIGEEDDEHELVMHFRANDNWDADFELELDGKTVKYEYLVARFGKQAASDAVDTAHEEGCFYA